MREFLIGIIGAIVGASASIMTVFIQSRTQIKQSRLKMVQELAVEEMKLHFEAAKRVPGTAMMLPMSIYLIEHLELAKIIEKKGTITPADLKQVNAVIERSRETVKQFTKER